MEMAGHVVDLASAWEWLTVAVTPVNPMIVTKFVVCFIAMVGMAVLAKFQLSSKTPNFLCFWTNACYMGCCLWGCEICMQLSLSPEHNNAPWKPLPDVLHKLLPYIDHTSLDSPWYGLPDKLTLSNVVLTQLYCLCHHERIRMCIQWGQIHGTLYMLRSFCMIGTTLPSPIPGCWGRPMGSGPLSSPAFEIYCNDCIFSGHTLCNMICTCWVSASNAPTLFKVFHAVYVLALMLVSIATRDHYTVDVMVAFFMTILVFELRRETIVGLFQNPSPAAPLSFFSIGGPRPEKKGKAE